MTAAVGYASLFLRNFTGANPTDRDSGQVAIKWILSDPQKVALATNAVWKKNNTVPEGAQWKELAGDPPDRAVNWSFPIPGDAIGVNVVLVYTDIVHTEVVMPVVLGSWTGAMGVGGKWTFQENGLDNELVGNYDPNAEDRRPPRENEVVPLTAAVRTYVEGQTGFILEERSSMGWNSGYDLKKPAD